MSLFQDCIWAPINSFPMLLAKMVSKESWCTAVNLMTLQPQKTNAQQWSDCEKVLLTLPWKRFSTKLPKRQSGLVKSIGCCLESSYCLLEHIKSWCVNLVCRWCAPNPGPEQLEHWWTPRIISLPSWVKPLCKLCETLVAFQFNLWGKFYRKTKVMWDFCNVHFGVSVDLTIVRKKIMVELKDGEIMEFKKDGTTLALIGGGFGHVSYRIQGRLHSLWRCSRHSTEAICSPLKLAGDA